MKTKLLITGSNGQLGWEFCCRLTERFDVTGVTREDFDLTDLAGMTKVIKIFMPNYVIHTAAFTDVDACEIERNKAIEINAVGTKNVAMAAQKIGAEIIYISTDYVFDGTKDFAYVESDQANPISEYGRSKYSGELAAMEVGSNWTIIRVGWIYSDRGNNFVKSILRRAMQNDKPLFVVNDQFGSPTWTRDIVNQVTAIIEAKQTGLFHVAAKGEVSRYEFAKMILKRLLPDTKIEPCATRDFPRPAKRPARSSLRSERLEKLGIDIMRPYDVCLAEFLDQNGEKLVNEFSH